jgi:hypothetical protein
LVPKGPKGQRRPADVIGNAGKLMRILTGEEAEEFDPDDGKDQAAQSLGQGGGMARRQGQVKRQGPAIRTMKE